MRRAVLGVVLVFTLATAGRAAEVVGEGRARPALAGHSFVEMPQVPSPFIRSSIRNRLGVGKARNLKFPLAVIDGRVFPGLQGDLVYALLEFEYQYAIREWLAVRANFALTGRLGTDVQALLAQGVTMVSGFELGWLARLKETERTALSLDLGLADRSFTGVNITRFVEDVIDGREPVLVNKSPSMRGYVGLRFAWAASPLLGVTTRGVAGYGESLDRRWDNEIFGSLGVALDFDVRAATSLPLGAAIGYVFDSFPEVAASSDKGIHAVTLRVSYVGREDFLLSLDFEIQNLPQPLGGSDVTGTSLSLNLRYYF